jgi:hypothetical protein
MAGRAVSASDGGDIIRNMDDDDLLATPDAGSDGNRLARPRRIRFSLRLVLLVVTLFAAIFAWRHAVDERRRHEAQLQRHVLEQRLTKERRSRDTVFKFLSDAAAARGGGRPIDQQVARELSRTNARLAAIRETLKGLIPPDDPARDELGLDDPIDPRQRIAAQDRAFQEAVDRYNASRAALIRRHAVSDPSP